MPAIFRYEDAEHAYFYQDEQVPSITQMLERTGWIDDTWYTDASSERGTAVHGYAADYDLGALDLERVPNQYRGWVLAHIEAVSQIRPVWERIEVAAVHPVLRFGGRPDRVGRVYGAHAILEIKSGAPHKAHPVQTALQALLLDAEGGLPFTSYQRMALYLKQSGRYRLERHPSRRDFDDARQVLRSCGRYPK